MPVFVITGIFELKLIVLAHTLLVTFNNSWAVATIVFQGLTVHCFYLLLCSMSGGLMYSYLTFNNKSPRSNTEGAQELKIRITEDSTGNYSAQWMDPILAFTTWWHCFAPYWSMVPLLHFYFYIHLSSMNRFPRIHYWRSLFKYTTKSWLNKLTKRAHAFWVRFSECLLKTNNYITVWTACHRNLTFEVCNKMSTKQAGSLYTCHKHENCWRMLAEGKTETTISNFKALHKLCTLHTLTNTMCIY